MAGLNGVFSAVRVYTVVLRFGTLLPCSENFMCLLPSWLCVSAIAQLIAVVICWKVYKLAQLQAFSGIYSHPEDASSLETGLAGSSSTNLGPSAAGAGNPRSAAFT